MTPLSDRTWPSWEAVGATAYVFSLAIVPPNKEASREDRFQLSGAGWTAEDDALLRSLIGSGKPQVA